MIAERDYLSEAKQQANELLETLQGLLEALDNDGDREAAADAVWHVEQALTCLDDVGKL